mgnify:CR=1 FL=1
MDSSCSIGVQKHYYPFEEEIKTKSKIDVVDFGVKAAVIVIVASIVLSRMYKAADRFYWLFAILIVYCIFSFLLLNIRPKVLYDDTVISTSIHYFTNDSLEIHRERITEYKGYNVLDGVSNELSAPRGTYERNYIGPVQTTSVVYHIKYSDIQSIEFIKAEETLVIHADMKKITYEIGDSASREISSEELKDFTLSMKVHSEYTKRKLADDIEENTLIEVKRI